MSNLGKYQISTDQLFSYAQTATYSQTNETTFAFDLFSSQKIVNPIFQQCVLLTDDTFWQRILEACAAGTFPRNFYYKNNTLNYRQGNRTFSVNLSIIDCQVALEQIQQFFTKHGKFCSEAKQEEMRIQALTVASELSTLRSNKFAALSKNSRSQLLHEFAASFGLSDKEVTKLVRLINIGISLKVILPRDITMKCDTITCIDGLVMINGKFALAQDKLNRELVKPRKINQSKTSSKDSHLVAWNRFLASLGTGESSESSDQNDNMSTISDNTQDTNTHQNLFGSI